MQYITTISKYLILVIAFSLSFLLGWQELSSPRNSNALGDAATWTLDAVKSRTIWQHLADNFTLDHQTDKRQVQTEIRKLLADQSRLYSILQAAGPYIYFIYNATKAHNIPAEIALIPFIESEFNPNDRSNKGATGLWQLMPQTARELGVKVKSGYDGRRNVIASTNAALTYFDDLISNFKGDWYLAIAAYNAGPGRILSATKRSGSHSFWQLPLPKETKLYVPRLLAVAEIVENPEKYGVELPPIHNTPYFTEVTTAKPVTLDKMAKSTGVNVNTLRKLNPDVKNKTVSQANGTHKILVPLKNVPVLPNKA